MNRSALPAPLSDATLIKSFKDLRLTGMADATLRSTDAKQIARFLGQSAS